MKKLFSIILIFLGFQLFAQDFSNPDAIIPQNEQVKIGKLDNGLTYYIRENTKPENKVELRLVVNAGSILETDKQLGLAHFMEHMNFNGTKNFEHNELVDYLQSIGVKFGQHLNAYTSFDETVYILPIPSDDEEKLEKGFDILEDWAFNNLLTPEEIDKERGVVLEELRLGLGANKRMLDRYLPFVMYKSHYADRLPIGKKEVIENFEHEELKDFYTTWYRPNLMAVIVVGDIDSDEIEEKIKDHFGSYKNPKNARERKEYYVPDHEETFVAIESDKEASFTNVQIMYKQKGSAASYTTVGDYRKYVTIRLFSAMLNDRLNEIANNPNPPFTYAFTDFGSGWSRNKNALHSYAMTSPENQLKAFKVMVTENERVKRHGFLQTELDRAKKQLLSNLESSLKNKDKTESSSLTRELVNHFLEDEFIPGIEWEYAATKALLGEVELEDVNGLINDFIREDNRVIVFTGPEGENVPKYSKDQVLNILKQVESADIAPYEEDEVASSLITEMPKAGEIASTEELSKLGMTKLVLSNGVTVYYKKTDFNDNQILMRAYSPGGLSLIKDHEEYKRIRLAMGGLSEAGLNGFSVTDMDKIMAGKNVSCSAYVSDDYEGLWGQTVNNDVEELFQLIHLNFTALNKDEEAFGSYIDKQVAFLGNLMNTPQYWFMNEKSKKIEANNPRFMATIPSAEEYKNQDYEKAYDVYQDRFSDAGDFTFLFVGSLDEEQIKKFSATYLASLPSTGRKESRVEHPYEKLKGKHEFVFYRGEDPKSTVEIKYTTKAKYTAEEAYYLKCMGEILSIKLIENLREGESGVYGVGARGDASKYEGEYYFTISFPCGPENVDKLKKAALAELQKLIENGPEEKDLNKIKEAQKLELKEVMKDNRFWAKSLYTLIMYNEDLNGILEKEQKIDALTAKNIQDAAKKFIKDDVVIAVLMPEAEKN